MREPQHHISQVHMVHLVSSCTTRYQRYCLFRNNYFYHLNFLLVQSFKYWSSLSSNFFNRCWLLYWLVCTMCESFNDCDPSEQPQICALWVDTSLIARKFVEKSKLPNWIVAPTSIMLMIDIGQMNVSLKAKLDSEKIAPKLHSK